MIILVLNSGSSSLKYQLIDTKTKEVLAKGNFERIGQRNAFLTHKVGDQKHKFELDVEDHEMALNIIISKLTSKSCGVISKIDKIDAIGHRVVHGGDKFRSSMLVNEEVLKTIEECIPLAPLHNPSAIAGIKACMEIMPEKPNVVAFDTAFHQTIPEERYIYPISYKYYEKYKIRKYGAHGMSHDYVSHRVATLKNIPIENLKIVNCHLGQGASICAICNGKSVDTSMGFTPLGGIPMGTRSGDLDPSVVTYIMDKENLTPQEMNTILNNKSGVFGVSEVSVDFRDIEAEAEKGDYNAKLAMDIFIYNVAQTIAKYAVAMQGIDVITFTAGVGEKGIEDREAICDQLKYFGVKLDKELNNHKNIEAKISTPDSKVEVWVIPTNEELLIAEDTEKIISNLH